MAEQLAVEVNIKNVTQYTHSSTQQYTAGQALLFDLDKYWPVGVSQYDAVNSAHHDQHRDDQEHPPSTLNSNISATRGQNESRNRVRYWTF